MIAPWALADKKEEKIICYIYWSRCYNTQEPATRPQILNLSLKDEDTLEASIMFYNTDPNWRFFNKDVIIPSRFSNIVGMLIPRSVLDLDEESIKALADLEKAAGFAK